MIDLFFKDIHGMQDSITFLLTSNSCFAFTKTLCSREFLRRGEIGSELTQSQSQCRGKSNEPGIKGASLLSIYHKNLLGDPS